jgi:hypothetical protein
LNLKKQLKLYKLKNYKEFNLNLINIEKKI